MTSSRGSWCFPCFCLMVAGWIALLGSATTALADDTAQGVVLSLVRGDGADGCITADLLEDEVRERLGRDPFTRPVRQHIECLMTKEGVSFVARLYERDLSGRRTGDRELSVSTANCRDLDDALALSVALLIDPEFLIGGSADRVSSPGSTAAHPRRQDRHWGGDSPVTPMVSIVTLLPSTGNVTLQHQSAAMESRVMIGVGGSIGLLPGLGPDLLLSLQHQIVRNWHGHLSVLYAPERQISDDTPTIGFGLTAFRMAGCWEGIEALAPFGCVGLAAGTIHSVVYGAQPVEPGDRGWMAVSGDLGIRRVFSPLILELRGQLTVPLLHWEFELLSGKGVYRQGWLVPALSILVGTHFP